MVDRSVVVRLRAEVATYIAGLKQAQGATTQFGREISAQGKTASADIERIGTASVLAGATVLAAFGKAAFTTANFEKELSGVKAVSGATADEMDRLSDAALAAGASTKLAGVTASDAARAEAELVKAGVSVSDVLGGALMGSLTLAAAGQLDFADAATIAAQAMNIFDLSGRDVTHVADVLAAAANKSAADVGQLGDALRQGGLVAAQTGLSLEESVGALAAFGDNALIGSDAGTSLKTMLQRLTPQSVEAANLMKELGFSAYDAYGNFIGLEGLAGELESSLGDMTVQQRNSAMATLFGSDAVRAANVLYEEGARGIGEYVDAVDDQGAAARMAAIQNDNLKGDVEALGGALESAFIENGSKATGALRAITQAATDVVGGFSELPDTLQTVTVGLGGIVGAASLLGGGFISVAPKIQASTAALKDMDSGIANFAGNNLGKITAGLAGIGAALSVGVYIYGRASEASRKYEADVAALATALAPVTEGQADLNEEMRAFFELSASELTTGEMSALNAMGISLADIEAAVKRGEDALDPMREAVRALGIDLDGIDLGNLDDPGVIEWAQDVADALGITVDDLRGLIDATEDWDNEAQASAQRAIESAISLGTFEQSAVDAAYELFTLKDGTTNYAAALAFLAPELATTEEGVDGVSGAMDIAAVSADELKETIDRLMTPLDTQAALDQFSMGLLDLADHFAKADAAVGEAQENMLARQEALNALLNTPVDQRGDNWARQVEDARDAVVQAQADIDEALAGTDRSLEGNSRAAIENRDMMRQLAEDAAAVMEQAAADESLTIADRIAIRDELVAGMEREATRVGLNETAVRTYTDVIRNIPVSAGTDVYLTGVETAMLQLEKLKQRLSGLLDIGMGMSVDMLQAESQLMRAQGATPRAGGGHLSPGVPYLFGERGPEVGVFGTAGHMFSSVDSASLARPVTGPTGGGGGYDRSVSQTNHITVPASTRRLARDIAYELDGIAVELAAS